MTLPIGFPQTPVGDLRRDVMTITSLVGLHGLDLSLSPPAPFEIMGRSEFGSYVVEVLWLSTAMGDPITALKLWPEILLMQPTIVLFQSALSRDDFRSTFVRMTTVNDGARPN